MFLSIFLLHIASVTNDEKLEILSNEIDELAKRINVLKNLILSKDSYSPLPRMSRISNAESRFGPSTRGCLNKKDQEESGDALDRPRPYEQNRTNNNFPSYNQRYFIKQNQPRGRIMVGYRPPPSSRKQSHFSFPSYNQRNLNGRPQNIYEKTIYVPRYTPQPGPRGPLPNISVPV